MTQDITTIVDGIKASIERVGKSARKEIYLDNITFRIDVLRAGLPRGCDIEAAKAHAEWFFKASDAEGYDPNVGHFIVNDGGERSPDNDIITFQLLPFEWANDGPKLSMTVNLWASDVVNDLPQTAAMCSEFLKRFADEVQAIPNRITFNVAYAFVLWDDVDQLLDWDEIEIPR